MSAYPEEIGNLDGVPAQVRSVANISRLDEAIAEQLAITQNIPLQANGIPDAENLLRGQNALAKLNDLYAIRDTLADHPEAGLMLLDTESNAGRVLAATFVGDVDNAKNVSVTTPGMNTRVSSSIDGMTGEAINLRNQALALAHGESVASIAWIGYETPALGTVTDPLLANVGATQLNHFYQGLAATTNVPDQHLTALGHSYGSLTTSLALQPGSPVDDVVLYGSPGGEIPNASLLGVGPGHAYFEVAQHDQVAIEIADYGRFGPQLQDVPGMTPLWTGDGWTHDASGPCVHLDGASGHSEYPRLGDNQLLRTSGYNMAAIVANNPGAVITGDPIPQMAPSIFPWLDAYNPNYHS
jgi:hypothetical protein